MAEFVNNPVMSVSMKLPTNANGNIAQSGDTTAGTKLYTIPGIKKGATLAEANNVFDKFVGVIGGGDYDSLSAVRTVKEGVA